MKNLAKMIACILVLLLAGSCGQSTISKQQVKALDSISGAINATVNLLQKTDTVSLNKILNVYQNYAQFINYRLNDTVSKTEAIELKTFFETGNNLIVFNQNKSILQSKLNLLNTQISKLSLDITNQSLNATEIEQYFQNEKQEADKTIQLVLNLQKEYSINSQKLVQSIKNVEEIIKTHNNNQLPTIITPADHS